MNEPTEYLPECSIEDISAELARIQFPEPSSVQPLTSTGSYHKIYRLVYSREICEDILKSAGIGNDLQGNRLSLTPNTEDDDNTPESASLILRVSGNHMPAIKTSNEVGILAYLNKHTSVPVPSVIHHNLTQTNLLRNEYMITTFMRGQNGFDVYDSLTASQMSHILDQLATICLDLYKLNFAHIGGLKPAIDSHNTPYPQALHDLEPEPGPPVLEQMWHKPEIEKYFAVHTLNATKFPANTTNISPGVMTFNILNAVSPTGYPTYTSWLAAQMTCYIRAINTHPSLHWIHTYDLSLTALQTFTDQLTNNTALQSQLNTIPLRLVHGDLHFGNILLVPDPKNPSHYRISAILDWEFANVLPYPFWGGEFLNSGGGPAPGQAWDWAAERRKKERLQQIWRDKVRRLGGEEGRDLLRDLEWQNAEQERAWDVVNYLRCVVEVCPRDRQWEDAKKWWKVIEKGVREFGIEIGEKDGNGA